jgi:uncharacterized membrane protein
MLMEPFSISLYLMAFFYAFAGIYHFVNPKFFLKIMPPYVPFHKEMVLISGMAELLLGIGLIFSKTQSIAVVGIILLLIAVFPANVYMAHAPKFQKIHPLIRWGRLPMQGVLIWWVYQYV